MQRHIVHACGHAQDHYLIGEFAADYDRQIERLARQHCRPCRTARSAPQALGDWTSDAVKLCILEGSPRQIAWAESIRRKRISSLMGRNPDAVGMMAAIGDAKWWIESRARSDAELISTAAAGVACDGTL